MIESLLATGTSRLSVSKRFSLTTDTLDRHWRNHTYPSQRAARAAEVLKPGIELDRLATEESSGLLQNLANIRGKLYLLFDKCVETGSAHTAAVLSSRIHENLRIVANLTGELIRHTSSNVTNILIHPDLMEVLNSIRLAVAPYPEARQAVIEALNRLDDRAMAQFTKPSPLTIEQRADAS